MKVRDLIEELQNFDDDMEVKIGMRQRYGTDFANDIEYDIEVRKIRSFWGKDYKALVITQGGQCGAVVYRDDDDDDDWDDDDEDEDEEDWDEDYYD